MTIQKHQGSCHCGAVQFEVNLDASGGTRCNCTICTKLAAVGAMTKPADFHLQRGQEALSSYSFGPVSSRYFCKHCGIYLYGKGCLEMLGGEFVSVNLNVLDDIDPGLLPIRYWDGRHDNWQAGMRETPWPIG